MKLLYDQNLPQSLVEELGHVYPASFHVRQLRLDSAADSEIWAYARAEGFTIVTRDSDFEDLLFLNGAPPKVIHVCRQPMTGAETAQFLKTRREQIETFLKDPIEVLMKLT